MAMDETYEEAMAKREDAAIVATFVKMYSDRTFTSPTTPLDLWLEPLPAPVHSRFWQPFAKAEKPAFHPQRFRVQIGLWESGSTLHMVLGRGGIKAELQVSISFLVADEQGTVLGLYAGQLLQEWRGQ